MANIVRWPNAWDANITEYNFRSSFKQLAKDVGAQIKTSQAIELRYPSTDVYQQHYDSSGTVERLVSVLDRSVEFLGHSITSSIDDMGYMLSDNIRSLEKKVIQTNAILSDGFDGVISGISDLRSDFNNRMGEVITILQSHRAILSKPMQTQAEEFKQRGIYCLKNNLMPEAVDNFERSKGHFDLDPMVYKFLGHLYLEEKELVDLSKAQENFHKAGRYVKHISDKIASECLFFEGYALAGQGQFDRAISYTVQALAYDPLNSEAHYQIAAINAQLRRSGVVIEKIDKAIALDRGYFRKALKDEVFDPVRKELNEHFKKIVQEHQSRAKTDLLMARQSVIELGKWHVTSTGVADNAMNGIEKAEEALNESRDIIDTHYVTVTAKAIRQMLEQTKVSNRTQFNNQMKHRHRSLEYTLNVLEESKILDIRPAKTLLEKSKHIDNMLSPEDQREKQEIIEKAETLVSEYITRIADEWETIATRYKTLMGPEVRRLRELRDRRQVEIEILEVGGLRTLGVDCAIDWHNINQYSQVYKIKVREQDRNKKFYLCLGCCNTLPMKEFKDYEQLEKFIKQSDNIPPTKKDLENYNRFSTGVTIIPKLTISIGEESRKMPEIIIWSERVFDKAREGTMFSKERFKDPEALSKIITQMRNVYLH